MPTQPFPANAPLGLRRSVAGVLDEDESLASGQPCAISFRLSAAPYYFLRRNRPIPSRT